MEAKEGTELRGEVTFYLSATGLLLRSVLTFNLGIEFIVF